MAESFQQYIKIRTFLGYRPKEILVELQNAFGDEAPTYASVQRWSKRFREAIDSPLGSPLPSESNFVQKENRSNQQLEIESVDGENDRDELSQRNGNAHRINTKKDKRSKNVK